MNNLFRSLLVQIAKGPGPEAEIRLENNGP